jgi:Arc/MetJ-type ribon-helix-helix transcriptional regulator
MPTKSINVTIDENILSQSDAIVASGKYANRSRFIEDSITLMLKKIDEEEIGLEAKKLKQEESEEWFEGELDFWQEKY